MSTPTVYTPKPLVSPSLLPGSTTTIYTCPAGGGQITSLLLCNVSGGAAAATFWAVPSGGSPADDNAVAKAYAVPTDGGGYNILPGGLFFMRAGDTIRGIADTPSAVAVHLHGVEFS